MDRRYARYLLLATVLLLAGCGRDAYPSLAVRSDERLAGSLPPVPGPSPYATPVVVTVPSSADLDTRLRQLVAEATDAHKAFLARQAGTEAAVAAASGAPVAAEAWSAATQALSRLVATRGPTAVALAELERLNADDRLAHAIADGNAGLPDAGSGDTGSGDAGSGKGRPDAQAIAAARTEVLAMASAEDAVLADLNTRLGARLPD